jgi:hypothetical protein
MEELAGFDSQFGGQAVAVTCLEIRTAGNVGLKLEMHMSRYGRIL